MQRNVVRFAVMVAIVLAALASGVGLPPLGLSQSGSTRVVRRGGHFVLVNVEPANQKFTTKTVGSRRLLS